MSTWNDVTTYIKTQLRPGVLGHTDVQKILNAILAIINQINAGSLDPQNEALWNAGTTYAKDNVPVLWMDNWLVSNITNNLGNVPINTSGTTHPTWRIIGSSSGSGINVWEAMVYPNELEIVFSNGGLYFLNREVAGDGPFVSSNFAAELSDGKWVPIVGSGSIITDGIVFLGAVTTDGNDITIDGAEVKINGTHYALATPAVITVPPPSAGTTRRDIIVMDINSDVILVQGTETDGVAIPPAIPANSVLLIETLSTDAGLDEALEAAITSYVRFDIGNQALSEIQRANARYNIRALRKDGNDTRTGQLDHYGIIHMYDNLVISTTGSDAAFDQSALSMSMIGSTAGARFRKTGALLIRSIATNLTDYCIISGRDNSGLEVFKVGMGGVTKGGDAINDDEFTTLGQAKDLIETSETNGTTKLSSENFFLGQQFETVEGEEIPVEVTYTKGPKDQIISDSGTLILDLPDMKNLAFTREATIIGVRYAVDGSEFSGVVRAGKPVTFSNTGTEANTQFLETHIYQDGESFCYKAVGGKWVLSENNLVGFSDTLNSVKAIRSVGSDGIEVVTNLLNNYTKKILSYRKVPGLSDTLIDGELIRKIGIDYLVESELWSERTIYLMSYGVAADGIADDTLKIQKTIDTLYKLGGGKLVFPSNRNFLVSMQGEMPYKNTDTGVLRDQDYCLLLRSNVLIDLNGSTLKMADNQNAAIFINEEFDYTSTPTTKLGVINGTLDSNGGNQGLASDGSTLSTISIQNASFVKLDNLRFPYSKETAIKLNAVSFANGSNIHIDKCEGNGLRIGSFTPTQVFEGRVKYSFFDKIYTNDTLGGFVGTIQGAPIVACAMFTTFGSTHCKNNGGGIKIQDGSLHVNIGPTLMEGPEEADYIPGVNGSNNSGLKIQGGSYLEHSPKYITVSQLICKNQRGGGLLMEYLDDCTVSSYIGLSNDIEGERGDVRVGNSQRSKITSIASENAGGSGIQLQPTAFDTIIDHAIVINPCKTIEKSGVQVWGGSARLGTFIIRDNRTTKRMLRAFDLNDVDAVGNLQYLIASGWKTAETRMNSANFTIFRKANATGLDTINIPELISTLINTGSNADGTTANGITARSHSGSGSSGISISGAGSRGQSTSGPGSQGVSDSGVGSSGSSQSNAGGQFTSQSGSGLLATSRSGRAGYFLQNSDPGINLSSPALAIQRAFTAAGNHNITGALIYANDAVVTGGTRNNPLVDLRWDGVATFRINKDGFIDIGGIFDATTTVKGKVELATLTEAIAGTDAERSVTPEGLQAKFDSVITYGTYSPIINAGSANPTITYTTQFGIWRRVGQIVNFDVRIEWTEITGAGSGEIGISLPVGRNITESNSALIGGLSIGFCSGITIDGQIFAAYRGNATGVRFSKANGSFYTVSDLSSAGILCISGSYRASS